MLAVKRVRAPCSSGSAYMRFMLLVANETCGNPAVEPYVSLTRIVNGAVARKHSWPWLCSVTAGDDGTLCVGSVIDNRHILTAASCL